MGYTPLAPCPPWPPTSAACCGYTQLSEVAAGSCQGKQQAAGSHRRQRLVVAAGSGSSLQRQPPHVGTSDNGSMLRAVVPPGHQGAGRELAGWHCVIRDSLDRVGFKPYAFATLRLPPPNSKCYQQLRSPCLLV